MRYDKNSCAAHGCGALLGLVSATEFSKPVVLSGTEKSTGAPLWIRLRMTLGLVGSRRPPSPAARACDAATPPMIHRGFWALKSVKNLSPYFARMADQIWKYESETLGSATSSWPVNRLSKISGHCLGGSLTMFLL